MSRVRVLLGAALLAGAALAAEQPASLPSPVPAATDPATGEKVALDPAQGPMHVVFLATWCQPCVQELPKLFDLDDRWKADGYRLFLVAVPTRQTAARLQEFGASQPHPGRLLFDADGTVTAAFGATNIPAHFLIDRKGTIVARAGTIDAAFKAAVERVVRQEGRARPS
ncbi:MAG TPA: TlpA disulfide reductase family protein [Candidatus Polarisedimenticolaceae bacterium]|nr:TlpA disulfide reductase family protein [Candidatus Polarisedimenticolaceae bacterium]